MHAAEDDHIRVRLCSLLRETERVAGEIRHVLDFRHLIIVRKDDGVELLFESEDFPGQRLEFLLVHSATRMNFSNINHGEKLPPFAASVNEGREL